MVTIRRGRAADVPDMLAFLDQHWKRGHIFTVEPSLFVWQHALPGSRDEYSMAIARRDSDGAVVGLLGYLPTRRFDPSLAADNTVWLALWKVRDDVEVAGLGLRLVKFVEENEPHTTIGVIGFNDTVAPLYRALGFSCGELRHYVLRNPDIGSFQLASFHSEPPPLPCPGDCTAVPVDGESFAGAIAGLDFSKRNQQTPSKTATYFFARYLQHPVYHYDCFVVSQTARPVGLLATRVTTHDGRRAIRIVDYLGPEEAIGGLGAMLLPALRSAGAEYADVYNWGIAPDWFVRGGFAAVDPDGGDVVPDHFEPFEPRNVRIRFAVKSERPVVLFKGDSDQDRPNRMPPA